MKATLLAAAILAGACAPVLAEGAASGCHRLTASTYDKGGLAKAVPWEKRDASAAIAACAMAIEAAPDDGRLRYRYARALDKAARDEEARTAYAAAAEKGLALGMRGPALLHESGDRGPKDPTAAETWYRKAIAAGDTMAANDLARMLAKGDTRLDETEALSRTAVAANPDEADAIDTLATIYTKTGRSADAVSMMKRVVALKPEWSSFHVRLGDAYAGAGRQDEARAASKRALALPDPDPTLDPDWDRTAVATKLGAAP